MKIWSVFFMPFFSFDENGWVITFLLFSGSSVVFVAGAKNPVVKSISVGVLVQFFLFLMQSSIRCGQIELVGLAS